MIQSNLFPIIYDKMDILFVPLNPPEYSNKIGHYFSLNNSFWKVLLKSGLITNKVQNPKGNSCTDSPFPDDQIFRQSKFNFNNAIFGIHDFDPKSVKTNSNKVNLSKNRFEDIEKLVKTKEIRILCLMHSKVRKAFYRYLGSSVLNEAQKYGLIGKLNNTKIYSVPFPHGSRIPQTEIIDHYSKMKRELLNSL